MSYDVYNRLIQVAKSGYNTLSFDYDYQGRRISKNPGLGLPVRNYLYDGDNIYGDYGSWTNPPSYLYVHGPNTDEPLIRLLDGFATPYFYHQDGLGSVVALTVPTGIFDIQLFDAWGNRLTSGGGIPQYGYTGREPDENGLLYYRARHYDPTIGKFLQRDPIGFGGGLNMYAYVSNNPINKVDPTGTIDLYYGPGNPIPGVANTNIPGINIFVQSSAGKVYPSNDFPPEWNGWKFNDVIGPQQTQGIVNRIWDDWMLQVPYVDNTTNFAAQISFGLDSGKREKYDFKPGERNYVNSGNMYVMNDGKASQYDAVTNYAWGGLANNFGFTENQAVNGSSMGNFVSKLFSKNPKIEFQDDPRDLAAIRNGYKAAEGRFGGASGNNNCRGAGCGGPPSTGVMKFIGWN